MCEGRERERRNGEGEVIYDIVKLFVREAKESESLINRDAV